MRGRTGAVALAAALAMLAGTAPGAIASEDRVRIRTADQARALADDAITVRVRTRFAASASLRAAGAGVRRLAGPKRIRLPAAAARRVELPLTRRGRATIEGAGSRCTAVVVRVRARISARSGRRARAEHRRSLGSDESRCARPAPSPGGEGDPPTVPPPGDPSPAAKPAPGGPPGGLRAGAASADITPPVGTPMFAYTARSRTMDSEPLTDPEKAIQVVSHADDDFYAKTFEPSEGIHTRVRASAIVIERDGEKHALVQADLGGVPYGLVQEVLARIGPTGIEGENLLLSATHTHSSTGPIWPGESGGYNLLGGDLFDPRVFEITAEGIAEAIVAADERIEPARAGVGTSELRGAANNRSFEPFRRNPEADGLGDAAAQEASLNRRVTVLRFDGIDGDPIALWSNFAVHQTSFGAQNLLLSGDNAATTERIVEREIARESGLPSPPPAPPGSDSGPVLAWTTGAQGDVSPDGSPANPDGEPLDWVNGSAASANMAGRKVAAGILEAWRSARGGLSRDLDLGARQTFVTLDGDTAEGAPQDPVGPLTVLGAGGIGAPDGFCAPADVPGQGSKFPALAGVGLVPQTAPVSLWRVGSLGIASFPFEITTQMGRRITGAVVRESGGRLERALIAGLTNGYQSYVATPEEYAACHYEGSFTLFGEQQGPLLRDVAARLVPSLVEGAPAPASDPEPPQLAEGTGMLPTATPTPDAGEPVSQPADVVRRFERATFSWRGGDPGTVDAQRGRTLVRLERRVGGEWRVVGTEEGPEDTTAFDQAADTWTETWQFGACDPLGTYRFQVTGRAVRAPGDSPEDYEVVSEEFELGPTAPLEIIDATVTGTTARVRARYPNPGEALLALPRRVRDGQATISLAGGGEVVAEPDADRLAFEAVVPEGAQISGVRVVDRCGNSSQP